MIFEKQEYQQNCINNIITLLEDFDFKNPSASSLKESLSKFYKTQSLPLQTLSNKLNIDILMETGTGKTFTYLNLIFELHKNYKQNKFIIFVPRKAIVESIKQNINLTKDYFYNEYKKHLNTYIYSDSKSQSNIISHYIKNEDELSVLILTNSAIDKKYNILNQVSESLFNTKSIFENIANLKPISIIDEPHLLKGEAFNRYFSKLNSLYFRFGATFPKEDSYKLSNLAYALDSMEAFNSYLVKQVFVHTLFEDDFSPKVLNIESKLKRVKFAYYIDNVEYAKFVGLNEDLGKTLSYPELNGVEILKITSKEVVLSNEKEPLKPITENYILGQKQISHLLSKSIDLHFKKERELFKQGIKALSLYFIPSIADFRGDKAFIKEKFENLYKQKRDEILKQELDSKYRAYLLKDFDSNGNLCVAQGYFSGDGKNTEEKETQGVKLILEEKEKLLSFDTPLRFIFSVWALQEGWDNPNIFTLTKLASSSSDTSRHQQIGRGLRLCVNNEGKRITHSFCESDDEKFFRYNALDVLVSNNEVSFIEGLQKEIEESSFSSDGEYISRESLEKLGLNDDQCSRLFTHLGNLKILEFDEVKSKYKIIAPFDKAWQDETIKSFLGDKLESLVRALTPNKHKAINNANKKPQKIKIKQNLAYEFKELWEKINYKAKIVYKDIDEQKLLDSIKYQFDSQEIKKEQIFIQSKKYDSKTNRIIILDEQELSYNVLQNTTINDNILQNLISFAKDSAFPLKLILEIYNVCNKQYFANNPKLALETLKIIIKEELHKNLITSISYDFIKTEISNNDLLFEPDGTPKPEIDKNKLGRFPDELGTSETPADNYLFESLAYDSEIEKETILNYQEKVNNTTIKVFAKIPKLSIPTPYKTYNPDFAYLLENSEGKKIFFVCETKGYERVEEIAQEERQKIKYAKKFFNLLQNYLGDEVKVIFKARLENKSLLELLSEELKGV